MTTPSFVSMGSGSISAPTWGAGHAADDMGLLVIETATETPLTSTGGTWTRVSPTGSRSDTRGTIDYRFAAGGAEAAAGISATAANHIFGIIANYRDVDMTDPIAAIACGQFASTTSGFSPKLYVPVKGCRLVCIVTYALDAATDAITAAANASLTGVTLRQDGVGTTDGNGGGLFIIDGVLTNAGAMEEFTFTLGSASGGSTTVIALRPNAEVAVTKNVKLAGANVANANDVVTLFNLTQPADPPITGIDISGGSGNWSSFVRYAGDTYQAVYTNGTNHGASHTFVA